jgi:hypothetical protein
MRNVYVPLLFLLAVPGCVDDDATDPGTTAQASVASANPRWPGGKLEYVIDYDGTLGPANCYQYGDVLASGDPLAPGEEIAILRAIESYEDFTPVRLTPASSIADQDVLIFTKRTRGTSGHANTSGRPVRGTGSGQMPPGKHPCVLLTGNQTDGTPIAMSADGVQHEIGHTIGMPHEQKRFDARTKYIDFDTTCVAPSDQDAFAVMAQSDGVILGPYDYKSMMHYGGFSKCCDAGDSEPGWTCPVSQCRDSAGNCKRPTLKRQCDNNNPYLQDDPTWCDPNNLESLGAFGHFSQGDLNTIFRMYEKKLGGNEPGDHFGATLASGDFNGDGYLDLAVGAPREVRKIEGISRRSGAVFLWRGTADRLVAWRVVDSPDPVDNGRFGAALAAGDLDGDNRDELVIGAPGEVYATVSSGQAHVFHMASSLQLDGSGDVHYWFTRWQTYNWSTLGQLPQNNAEIGAALAIGDFNNTGVDDLAIGVPGGGLSGSPLAGYVSVVRGRDADTPLVWRHLKQDAAYTERAGDRFGAALAAGSVGISALTTLVVGAPESGLTGPIVRTGAAYVFTATTTGMTAGQELRGSSVSNAGYRFGSAITIGAFNGIGIVIGAPEELSAQGRLYVYRVNTPLIPFPLFLSQTATAPSPSTAGDRLGSVLSSVRVSGNTVDILVAGMPDRDVSGNVDAGSYVRYTAGTSGILNTAGSEVLPPSIGAGRHFGSAVAVTGVYDGTVGSHLDDKVVIGAEGSTGAGEFHVRAGSTFETFDQETAHPE